MRFVDERLQDRHRICHHVLDVAGGREGVVACRVQLDPIGAAPDLLPDGRARLVDRVDHGAGQRVRRRRGRRGAPDDSERGHLKSGTVDAPVVDRVADLDVAVPVAVGGHVACRREARPQIGLHVLHGDEHRRFCRRVRSARIEHVRVRVDQAGQHRQAAEIDHERPRRNRDVRFRADIGNALAPNEHHLFRQHLTGLAVDETPGADRDRPGSRWALVRAAVGSDARLWTGAAPRRPRRLRAQQDTDHRDPEHRQRKRESHRAALHGLL